MLARDRRREKENPLRIRPIPKRTPAHQQHVPQQHQEENDVGTCTLHYQEIEKVVETTEETRKAELELFLKQNVCINKNEYIQLSGLTRHAAIDELNNFIRQGFLRRRGMGRSTVYVRQEKDTANEI